jgi:hypothetical protein
VGLAFVGLNGPPNRRVGGGPAGVEEGLGLKEKDRPGGGPAGVVEGPWRPGLDSGVDDAEGDRARNIVVCFGCAPLYW